MILPDYAVWFAVFVFFASEHVKWLDERVVIAGLKGANEGHVYLSRSPIKIGRRYVYVLPLFSVLESFFVGHFFSRGASKARSSTREMKRLRLRHRALMPFLVLEPSLFAFYFLFCPLLTLRVGLGPSLRVILPMHLGFLLLTAAMIMFLPGLPLRRASGRFGIVAEMIVSPGLIPALSKRLSSKVRITADLPSSIVTHLSSQEADQLRDVVNYRLEELIKFGEATPEAAGQYLDLLGVAK
jgi:hypothetical protein